MKIFKSKKLNFVETRCEEDNLVLLHKNCENCGAPLKLNKETMSCKCAYCDTEYYVKNDVFGNFDIISQLITLNIHGQEKKFYIGEDSFNTICGDSYISASGNICHNKIIEKEKIILIEI